MYRLAKYLIYTICGICVVLMCCHVLFQQLHWYINTTDSLPYGLYKAHYLKQPQDAFTFSSDQSIPQVALNTLVLFCLDEPWASFAQQRGYLSTGKCPNQIAPLGKFIVALEGDMVKLTKNGIMVNNHLLKNTKSFRQDAQQRAMPYYQTNTAPQYMLEQLATMHSDTDFVEVEFTVKAHEAVVCSFTPSSFDSRYFGPIPLKNIHATLSPILTW